MPEEIFFKVVINMTANQMSVLKKKKSIFKEYRKTKTFLDKQQEHSPPKDLTIGLFIICISRRIKWF